MGEFLREAALAYEDRIKQLVTEYKDKKAAVAAISPNDPQAVRLDELMNYSQNLVMSVGGTYWAPVAGGGGTGTWDSSLSNWASGPGAQGSLAQATTGLLHFTNAAGTVTVNGTATASGGLQFETDGALLPAVAEGPAGTSVDGHRRDRAPRARPRAVELVLPRAGPGALYLVPHRPIAGLEGPQAVFGEGV